MGPLPKFVDTIRFGQDFPTVKKVVLLSAQMKHFLDVLTNVRIGAAEIGGTLSLLFLIAYGLYKAWQEFIVKLFK
jgi:hypothetical protein